MVDLREDLHELELKGVEVTIEEEVGRGSYGKVVIVFYKGLKCAGKILHDQLTQNASSDDQVNLAKRFADECIHMSNARHPNITLFLGVYFQPKCEYPVLVMEYLPMCLHECLAKYLNLPAYVKNNILLDVARGLHYLYCNDLIHRDLTTKNILIGENLQAKITDLGVATIISPDAVGHLKEFTEVPGNAQYMPPEAFAKSSDQMIKYDSKLDIFAFGNLIINTVTHTWPNPKGIVHLLKEVERRRADLELMGKAHPLKALTELCLRDDPVERPSTNDIISFLDKVMSENPAPFRNTMELLQDYCRLSEDDENLQGQLKESDGKKVLMEQTVRKLEDVQEASVKQISVQEKEIQDMHKLLSTKHQEIHIKENLLHRREERIQALNMKIASLSQTSTAQVSLFDPMASLSVDELSNKLPQSRKHAQVIVQDNKVYVGSGYCESDELSHNVDAYCLKTNRWEKICQSDTRWYAMAVYENDLVLVSGKYRNGEDCTRVAKFSKDTCTWMWQNDIMDLSVARMGASATAIASHLLLAGGWDSTRNRVNTVEVYDKHKRQWFKAQPLPKLVAECKTALIDNSLWFFMGGANQEKSVFYASIQAIIKQAVPPVMERPHQEAVEENEIESASTENQQPDQLWKMLPDVPHEFSCAAVLGGSLVSIGGTGFFRNSKAIYAYISHTNTWLKVGEMPEECCRAVAVPLKDGSILVLGGVDRNKRLVSIINKITVL